MAISRNVREAYELGLEIYKEQPNIVGTVLECMGAFLPSHRSPAEQAAFEKGRRGEQLDEDKDFQDDDSEETDDDYDNDSSYEYSDYGSESSYSSQSSEYYQTSPSYPSTVTPDNSSDSPKFLSLVGTILIILLTVGTANLIDKVKHFGSGGAVSEETDVQPVISSQEVRIPENPPGIRENILHLTIPPDSTGEITVSPANRLAIDGIPISPPLLYAGTDQPYNIILSSPSPGKRYTLLTICGAGRCDETWLVDRQNKFMKYLNLFKDNASNGISWSPDNTYVLARWCYGSVCGIIAMNLKSLKTLNLPAHLTEKMLPEKISDIHPPSTISSGPPRLSYEIPTVLWEEPDRFQIEANVEKIRREGNTGSPVITGRLRITFSIPPLALEYSELVTTDVTEIPGSSPIPTQPDPLSHMDPLHAEIFKKWLSLHPEWRPASLEECDCKNYLPIIRKHFDNQHPYYATGDFNKDDVTDFAAVIVSINSGKSALVIFNGPFKDTDSPSILKTAAPPREVLLFHDGKNHRLFMGTAIGAPGKIVEAVDRSYDWQFGYFQICGSKAGDFGWLDCSGAPDR